MRFTIIVPVYNAQKYLRACLDSVLAQTFGDFEVICVDDGSSDGSAAILDEYVARDFRCRVLRQANAGVSAARNAALDVAQGELVLFLDADDGYVGNALEILDKVQQGKTFDIVEYEHAEVDEVVECCANRDAVVNELSMEVEKDAVEAYIRSGNLIAWNACYRRSAIGNVRFKKIPLGEDSVFGFEVLTCAHNVAFVSEKLYQYRKTEGSVIRTHSLINVISAIDSFTLFMDVARRWKFYNAIKKPLKKRIRTSFCGQAFMRILALGKEDRTLALRHFFDKGVSITDGFGWYNTIFRKRKKLTFRLLIFEQFRARAFFAQIRASIRGLVK